MKVLKSILFINIIVATVTAHADKQVNKNQNNPFPYSKYYPTPRDPYYMKGELGVTGFSDINMDYGTKARPSSSVYQSFGVGAYIADGLRGDIMLTHFNETTFNFRVQDGHSHYRPVRGNIKAYIDTAMFSLYYNVLEYNSTQIFVDLGMGLSRHKAKFLADYSEYTKAKNVVLPAESLALQTRKKDTFAYQAGAGIAFNVSPGVNVEASYVWKDLGKVGDLIAAQENLTLRKAKYKSHNITFGVRVDIDNFRNK